MRTRAWAGLVLLCAATAGLVVAATLTGASSTPWAGTPGVYQEGRLDAAARAVPVADAATVLAEGAYEAEQASPWRLDLDGEWSFRWSPSASDADTGFVDPAVDVSGWDTVEVPHQWQLDGYGDQATHDLVYLNEEYPWEAYGELDPFTIPDEGNSVGSYRRSFDVPDAWDGRRTVLAFQGVKSAYTVWVNGIEVGYSESSYSPAEFDVTAAVHPGANTIAVLVHRWSDGSWLENQDQIDLSGIFRSVDLYSTPLTYLADHTVTTHVADDLASATVHADVEVVGDATVRATLHDAEGAVVGEATGASSTIDVPDARLWSAEDPYLYTLVYELLEGGEVTETVATRVGIREFGIVDGLMTLNGMPLDIKGVNRSEMSPDTGQAFTEEQTREDLLLMRQHNITAVRTSHYPASPDLYRLADEIGMYVLDEANLETHELRRFPDGAPEWDAAVMDRIVSLYERDKNHPSVLWWSLGNEVGPGEIFAEAADWLRSVDPGRLVHFQEDSTVADVDGVFYPYLSTLEERAATTAGRPWIMTEYQHALGNALGGIEEFWQVIDTNPEMQGGFVWQWADQAIRLPIDGGVGALPVADDAPAGSTYLSYGSDWGDAPTDGPWTLNGVVNPDRVPQPELADLAAVYAPVELVSSDGSRIQVRNEHLFTDLSELAATWTLEADGVPVDSGSLVVSLAPGSTGWVDVPVTAPADPVAGATYRVTVSFALASDSAWASAGHVVASLQTTMPWDTGTAAVPSTSGRVAVDDSGDAITVTGEGFTAAFSTATGALTSYAVDGADLLAEPWHPDFWRAPTQNDLLNGVTDNARSWEGAGEALEDVDVRIVSRSADAVTLDVTATVPATGDPSWNATYTVTGDGAIAVDATLGATSRAFEIPAVGMELTLPGMYQHLTWLGRGPGESWGDRHAGQLTSLWTSTVADQVFPYVVPQATGNHTGVEWWAVTDDAGAGLLIAAGVAPLEAATLPVTEAAIEAAGRPFELEPDGLVHLSVDAVQQGLGLTWGERALPFATVAGDEPHMLAFTLSPLRAGEDPGATARGLAAIGAS
ncbi:glycoside hydrolase family 2 TIM barrel-domain containing protein [Demequina soli]|uniref:glycoside hydrolase family 2 TIM barrel-domain containing protein n=1 Tax=Demequina soli TaxID=1638987 RepID=UPI000781C8F8|nr:glycoside hydrolase family 2 TIM barrel-domain containing protein [Demequina soli]